MQAQRRNTLALNRYRPLSKPFGLTPWYGRSIMTKTVPRTWNVFYFLILVDLKVNIQSARLYWSWFLEHRCRLYHNQADQFVFTQVCIGDIHTDGNLLADFRKQYGHDRVLFVRCDVTSDADIEGFSTIVYVPWTIWLTNNNIYQRSLQCLQDAQAARKTISYNKRQYNSLWDMEIKFHVKLSLQSWFLSEWTLYWSQGLSREIHILV